MNSVLTIGNFDGVHLGHVRIIQDVVKRAQSLKAVPKVITFDPHPMLVIKPQNYRGTLITLDQKIEKLKSLGITEVDVIPFSRDLADITPYQFYVDYLVKPHQPKEIHIGYDFSFGKGRAGNIESLKEFCDRDGISLVIHHPYKEDETIISSSKIRDYILEGKVEDVRNLLGEYYSLTSNIVRGDGRGRTIGFPTANLANPNCLIPKIGVYATLSTVDGKRYFSITNVGKTPTFKDDNLLKVESHFFNFDQDIYGKMVKVEFLSNIREEFKFSNVAELTAQIKKDIDQARAFHQGLMLN